jgi:hypothetical protein
MKGSLRITVARFLHSWLVSHICMHCEKQHGSTFSVAKTSIRRETTHHKANLLSSASRILYKQRFELCQLAHWVAGNRNRT